MTPEEKLFRHMLKQVNSYDIIDVRIIATEYGIRFNAFTLDLRKKLAIALIANMRPEEYQQLLSMFR
jgi:hypothetical protein